MEKYLDHYWNGADDIADVLIHLAVEDKDNEKLRNNLIEALYDLQAVAQNPYNRDSYRVLWNILQVITDYTEIPKNGEN